MVSNQEATYSSIEIGAAVEIKVRDDLKTIFKGEVVGLEAFYKSGEKKKLLIRAMNKMHRLLRMRKSLTFTDKTDKQILEAVARDAGLTLDWKHEKDISYKHVYQHNQTDLEFLRMRAGRMGCHVWCEDTTLHVKQPELQGSPQATLSMGEAGGSESIRCFTPRLSSASILKKVTVKGWNPETKELIEASVSAQNSQLGKENAATASKDLGKEETFTVDHPIWTKEEATALAKARLTELSLTYITGECVVGGNPTLELGKLVEVSFNAQDQSSKEPFDGKYYVMGLSHRMSEGKGPDTGYTTTIRLARDAQKKS
jgi:phage protein D